jgi:DNA-binding LytR/AlgR family response regulator
VRPPIKAIIADDEPLLRRWLADELQAVWPELDICAQAENGIQALELIATRKPQIAFLDIRMPGLSGLEVARRVATSCRIVFITAFDQFAVQAFEQATMDYLLKPVERSRLELTVARLRHCLADATPAPDLLAPVLHLLEQRLKTASPPAWLQWITVQERQQLRLLAVTEVAAFRAEDKYTVVTTAQGEYLIRKPLKELGCELDPERFWQIHRSAIVQVAAIDTVTVTLTGRQVLTLAPG